MKKLIGFVLAVFFIFLLPATVFAAEDPSADGTETFSYHNADGDLVTVVVIRDGDCAESKVYLNGVLIQSSVADASSKTVDTEIYDMASGQAEGAQTETEQSNGFEASTTHMPVSNEILPAALRYTDPLNIAGDDGGTAYAPNAPGFLYQPNMRVHHNEAAHRSADTGDAASVTVKGTKLIAAELLISVGLLAAAGGVIGSALLIKRKRFAYQTEALCLSNGSAIRKAGIDNYVELYGE